MDEAADDGLPQCPAQLAGFVRCAGTLEGLGALPVPLEHLGQEPHHGRIPHDDGLVAGGVGGDDREGAVHDDQPVEELVERPDLRAQRGYLAHVVAGGTVVPGGVLVEGPHLHPAVEQRLGLPADRVQGGLRPGATGLRREQLLRALLHRFVDDRADGGLALDPYDRHPVRRARVRTALGDQRAEQLREVARLLQHHQRRGAQLRAQTGLDDSRVHGDHFFRNGIVRV
ncbi:hypothetical protein ACH4MA_15330 [Streptomyces roseolus]